MVCDEQLRIINVNANFPGSVHGQFIFNAAEISLAVIQRWMETNHIRTAPYKTDIVIMEGSREREGIKFTIGCATIISQSHIKYLEIWIDDKLNSREHIRNLTEKAEYSIATLPKIMPNNGGPMSGITPEVQKHAGDCPKEGTSKDGLCIQVIAGIVPIELRIIERTERIRNF
ncbi:hypothetical protein JTB14_016395 [Gonioctena quinquepunctata]|nr:hypothetical protein JTB14_016395 [Gonioctena quinquepunctata]